MTNHIEELMKAAGVKQYKRTYFECKGGRSTICLCPQIGVPNAWCKDECGEMQEKVEYFNPAFTPAKQLELIKLINKKHRNIRLCWLQSDGTYGVQVNPVVRAFGMYYESESFEDLIAIVTFELLKANELDKAEVRRILEE